MSEMGDKAALLAGQFMIERGNEHVGEGDCCHKIHGAFLTIAGVREDFDALGCLREVRDDAERDSARGCSCCGDCARIAVEALARYEQALSEAQVAEAAREGNKRRETTD